MGADDSPVRKAADSPAPHAAPDLASHYDEGTPVTDAAADLPVVAAVPADAAATTAGTDNPADGVTAFSRDEGHALTPGATDGTGETAQDYRREGFAHSALAGAADRAAAQALTDRGQGYIGRADQAIERASQERAAAQKDFAHANQIERFSLERESLDLLRQAQQLEKAGDAAGATALREQADAKLAAASDKLDQAIGHAANAIAHESLAEDRRLGQQGAAMLENAITVAENLEFASQTANAIKDVTVQAMRVAATALEAEGPRGLSDAIADVISRFHAELKERL